MPAMIRSNDKATKIAYAILGKPDKSTSKTPDREMNRRLQQEYTRLVR